MRFGSGQRIAAALIGAFIAAFCGYLVASLGYAAVAVDDMDPLDAMLNPFAASGSGAAPWTDAGFRLIFISPVLAYALAVWWLSDRGSPNSRETDQTD